MEANGCFVKLYLKPDGRMGLADGLWSSDLKVMVGAGCGKRVVGSD